jgi:hypothetical protein
MRSYGIVVPSRALDKHLASYKVEKLPRQEFVAQLGVEALAIAVLPKGARLDQEHLHANPAEPGAHIAGDELRAIVGTNVLRRPVRDEKMCHAVMHVVRIEFARHHDGRTAPRELVDGTVSMRNRLPSSVQSCMKSYDHTWLGRSGLRRTHDPSLSHRHPLCFGRSALAGHIFSND